MGGWLHCRRSRIYEMKPEKVLSNKFMSGTFMKISNLVIILIILGLAAFGNPGMKPSNISDGDLCHYCKMAISEQRYSAEVLDADGEASKFDEIGCMRNYLQREKFKPAAIYV